MINLWPWPLTNVFPVLGAKEMQYRSVSIRTRDSAAQSGEDALLVIKLDEAIEKLKALRESRALENKLA